MTPGLALEEIVELMQQLHGGRLTVDWEGSPWVDLDANRRELEVDLAPLARAGVGLLSLLRRDRIAVWGKRGLPQRLADAGWRVTLTAGGRPVLSLGRGTRSALGNVHVEWRALPDLVRLL